MSPLWDIDSVIEYRRKAERAAAQKLVDISKEVFIGPNNITLLSKKDIAPSLKCLKKFVRRKEKLPAKKHPWIGNLYLSRFQWLRWKGDLAKLDFDKVHLLIPVLEAIQNDLDQIDVIEAQAYEMVSGLYESFIEETTKGSRLSKDRPDAPEKIKESLFGEIADE